MTWIERLFGKKENELTEIGFDELPDWLESRSRKIADRISEDAPSIFSQIEKALSEIKKSTAKLEGAKPEGRFHLKLVKIAASNRDNMAKQVKMLLENIVIPKCADQRGIAEFYENSIQTLTVCLDNMMKSYQYTKLVYFEESKDVIADVNALGRLLNQLIDPINENKAVLNAFDNSKSLIQNIRNTTSDILQKEKTIIEGGEKIILIKNELEEDQKALAVLKGSDNWKEYTKLKEELVLLENKTREKESEITALILPLNKALGRLKQLSDSGRYTLKPQDREALNQCLSRPSIVRPDFFIEFQNIVNSKVLNLPPDKEAKIIEQIQIVSSSLGARRAEYEVFMADIEQKKDEISKLNIDIQEKNLNVSLSALKEKLAAAEQGLEVSRKLLESNKTNIELKRQDLQKNILVIDSKTKIVYK